MDGEVEAVLEAGGRGGHGGGGPHADSILLVGLDLAPAWMVTLIVGREFAVSGMRSIAATRGFVMAASSLGKSKTVAQVAHSVEE